MKKRHCPSCGSTLRSKQKKKKLKRLLFFTEFLTCSRCDTQYSYVKGVHRSVKIKSGNIVKV